jgi:hypothetical protein
MAHIDNLEEILEAGDINSSIIELDNRIGELCNYGDNMDVLTDAQKHFYLNQNLEREVNNGGFGQYFINSSGDYAHETVRSLKLVGAAHTGDILQKAIDHFPNKKVPKDRDDRISIVEKIEENASEVWDDLDQKFYEYADDLNTLNIEYVKRNKGEF